MINQPLRTDSTQAENGIAGSAPATCRNERHDTTNHDAHNDRYRQHAITIRRAIRARKIILRRSRDLVERPRARQDHAAHDGDDPISIASSTSDSYPRRHAQLAGSTPASSTVLDDPRPMLRVQRTSRVGVPSHQDCTQRHPPTDVLNHWSTEVCTATVRHFSSADAR